MDLKVAKEAFVSDLKGTTLIEATCVASFLQVTSTVAYLAFTPGASRCSAIALPAIQFLLLVVPQILLLTDAAPPWTAPAALGCLTAYLLARIARLSDQQSHRALTRLQLPRKDYLTVTRASLLLLTAICILAVDFPAFPRRFAKAETFGTGIMDLGTGAFVLMSGIMSHRAATVAGSGEPGWLRHARSTAPLLALGVGRLLSVKAADYQEHAGEYGVHWNFFFTLAAVSTLQCVLTATTGGSRGPAATAGLSLAVLCVHQAALSAGLSELVMAPEREGSLWMQNKEGLASLPGYASLHLAGRAVGTALHTTAPRHHRQAGKGTNRISLHLWFFWLVVVDAALWVTLGLLSAWVEPVSRRSCNAAYVAWVLALSGVQLVLAAGVAAIASGDAGGAGPPDLLCRINRHMLLGFLLANVLTGAVNMSVDTLAVGRWPATAILCVYMAAVCAGPYAWEAWASRAPRGKTD